MQQSAVQLILIVHGIPDGGGDMLSGGSGKGGGEITGADESVE